MKDIENTIHELDVVALLRNHTELGLIIGQVGTVVELLSSDTVEVEFTNLDGETFALSALNTEELLILHYAPVAA